jgi:hypothetical protein
MQENTAFEELKADFVALQIHYKMLQERLNAALVVAPSRDADYIKIMEKVQLSDFEHANNRKKIEEQAINLKKWSEYATHLEEEKAALLKQHTELKASATAQSTANTSANHNFNALQDQLAALKKLNESQKIGYEAEINDLKQGRDTLINEKNTAARQAALAKSEYDKLKNAPPPPPPPPVVQKRLTFFQQYGFLLAIPALLLGWFAHAKRVSKPVTSQNELTATSKIQRYADYMSNNNVNFHAFMKQGRFDDILNTLEIDVQKPENQPIVDLLEVQKQFYNTAKNQRENISEVVYKRQEGNTNDVFFQETTAGAKAKGATPKATVPKKQTPPPVVPIGSTDGGGVGVSGIPGMIEIHNTNDGATVRGGFERDAGIVGKVKKGTKCEVLTRSPQKLKRTVPIDGKDTEIEEYAYKIKFKSGNDDKEGWVYGFYVKIE